MMLLRLAVQIRYLKMILRLPSSLDMCKKHFLLRVVRHNHIKLIKIDTSLEYRIVMFYINGIN